MNNRYYLIVVSFYFLFISCEKNEIEDNLISECNCFIETADDTYKYPIRPGSEEWKVFESSEQMNEAVQIPLSILDTMSTLGIFESCAENPLCLELYISSSPQHFYDIFKTNFNVFKALVTKDDAAKVLINRYLSMCLDCDENNYSSFSGKGGDVQYAFVSIELFLAQEEILTKTTRDEILNLAKQTLKNYEINVKNNQSLFFTSFPVWIASRIMINNQFPEYVELLSQNDLIFIFNETGIPQLNNESNYSELDLFHDIMEKLKIYLNKEL